MLKPFNQGSKGHGPRQSLSQESSFKNLTAEFQVSILNHSMFLMRWGLRIAWLENWRRGAEGGLGEEFGRRGHWLCIQLHQ